MYERVAAAGLLFKLDPNATTRVEPWEQPCDRHARMALGFHHVCTIDTNASLQCDGHNSAGQADAGRQPRPRRLPGDTRHAPPATEEEAADGYGGGYEEYAPLPPDAFAYAEVCAGEYHTLGLTLTLTLSLTLNLTLALALP